MFAVTSIAERLTSLEMTSSDAYSCLNQQVSSSAAAADARSNTRGETELDNKRLLNCSLLWSEKMPGVICALHIVQTLGKNTQGKDVQK